jgi:hypothetical protein
MTGAGALADAIIAGPLSRKKSFDEIATPLRRGFSRVLLNSIRRPGIAVPDEESNQDDGDEAPQCVAENVCKRGVPIQ